MSSLSSRFALARRYAEEFLRAEIPALELELRLLSLGYYNVEFSPPAACLDGIRYPLTHSFTELA